MGLESAAKLIGHINLWVKLTGKRSAGNLYAAFDEAGAGNGAKGWTEAPAHSESCRQQLLPVSYGYRASFRPYLREAGVKFPGLLTNQEFLDILTLNFSSDTFLR